MEGTRARIVARWRGVDPRELPAYSFADAAHYLRIPRSTLRWWALPWTVKGRRAAPLLQLPEGQGEKRKLLSFLNLVECHVLAALRHDHGVTLPRTRAGLNYVRTQLHVKRPLLHQQFETDGVDLFVRHLGHIVNASRYGQQEIRATIEASLRRVERGPDGLPLRLFPFVGVPAADAPRPVVIDPQVSFGRPVVAGTGVPTAEVADRFRAGESVESLADDFSISSDAVQDALRCETREQAA